MTKNVGYWHKQEEAWLDKEGSIDEQLWYSKMIEIYRNLSRLSPEETYYRLLLGKYLMEYATDLKLRYENYRKAKELFESILEIDPEKGQAKYHLGYIYFMDEYWSDALKYLQEALETKDLSKQQKIRGLLASAVCLHKIHKIDEAEDLYQEAKSLDKIHEHSTEFQLTRAQMAELPEDNHKPYIIHTQDQQLKHISENEAYDILESGSKEYPVLDLREPDHPLFIAKCEINLQRKEAQLLRELILSRQVKSNSQLREALWSESNNPQIVKRFISSLRKKLQDCFEEPVSEVILTVPRQGYKWTSSKTVSIISLNKGVF